MANFYIYVLGTDAGYRFSHPNIESATTEAKRLHDLTQKEVHILELVGTVKTVEIPVVQKTIVVKLDDRFTDTLPF